MHALKAGFEWEQPEDEKTNRNRDGQADNGDKGGLEPTEKFDLIVAASRSQGLSGRCMLGV